MFNEIPIFYNMKMIFAFFTISRIGSLGYLFTYCTIKCLSYFTSIDARIFVIMISSIIVFIENTGLVYEVQNIIPINDQEHISIIDNRNTEK